MALFRSRCDQYCSNTGRTAGLAGWPAIIRRTCARSALRSLEPALVRCALLLCVVLLEASSGATGLVCLDMVIDRAMDLKPVDSHFQSLLRSGWSDIVFRRRN